MIAFIEETCVRGLRPFLDARQRTVGTHVDVSHVAATAVGMTVTAEIELTEIDGKSLLFRVTCRDEAGLIGEGTHRRAIVDIDRFMKKLGKNPQRWRLLRDRQRPWFWQRSACPFPKGDKAGICRPRPMRIVSQAKMRARLSRSRLTST